MIQISEIEVSQKGEVLQICKILMLWNKGVLQYKVFADLKIIHCVRENGVRGCPLPSKYLPIHYICSYFLPAVHHLLD